MKLRNKKTGVKGDYQFLTSDGFIKLWNSNNHYENYRYYSLREFNKDWEDCKPAKPLVEGRKQRAVLRAAARFSGTAIATVKWCEVAKIVVFDFGGKCRVELKDIGINIKSSGVYTIEELCGEEEKPRAVIADGVKYHSYEDYLKSKQEE